MPDHQCASRYVRATKCQEQLRSRSLCAQRKNSLTRRWKRKNSSPRDALCSPCATTTTSAHQTPEDSLRSTCDRLLRHDLEPSTLKGYQAQLRTHEMANSALSWGMGVVDQAKILHTWLSLLAGCSETFRSQPPLRTNQWTSAACRQTLLISPPQGGTSVRTTAMTSSGP